MKRTGWVVEWREEGFRINGSDVDFHPTRAAAERAMRKERDVTDHLDGQVLSLHRVAIDPEPVLVLRSKGSPEEDR